MKSNTILASYVTVYLGSDGFSLNMPFQTLAVKRCLLKVIPLIIIGLMIADKADRAMLTEKYSVLDDR